MDFHAVTANCASPRHSILRLWHGPSPRAYSPGIISHGLSYRYGKLCRFEVLYPAPLARLFSKGLLAGDYLTWAFMPLQRIVPLRGTLSCAFGAALLQGPTRRGLSHIGFHAATANCASSRHSILRLWRGPSPRAYSRGIVSHRLSCRYGKLCLSEALYPAPLARPFSKGLLARGCLIWAFMPLRLIVPLRGTLSCAFGAALLQGPTRRGLSHMGFHTATTNCASPRHCNPLPLARPFSKGLLADDYLTWAFMPLRRVVPLRGPILRLWRGPSPRAYSLGIISHGLSYRRRLTICLLFSQSLRRCAGGLPRGRS